MFAPRSGGQGGGQVQGILGQRSLASEWAALLAVAYKEWLIFRRYAGRLANMVIWPILFPLGYIFSARALSGPDGSQVTRRSTW